jgi:hypothetical protein
MSEYELNLTREHKGAIHQRVRGLYSSYKQKLTTCCSVYRAFSPFRAPLVTTRTRRITFCAVSWTMRLVGRPLRSASWNTLCSRDLELMARVWGSCVWRTIALRGRVQTSSVRGTCAVCTATLGLLRCRPLVYRPLHAGYTASRGTDEDPQRSLRPCRALVPYHLYLNRLL